MPRKPSSASFPAPITSFLAYITLFSLLGLLYLFSYFFPGVCRRLEVGEAKVGRAGVDGAEVIEEVDEAEAEEVYEVEVDTPEVYVLGLLATSDLGPTEDRWMATDFIALREILGADDNRSQWMSSKSIHEGNQTFLISDSDKLILDNHSFETVVAGGPQVLRVAYCVEVGKAASKLRPSDALVLVLVGHGDRNDGSLIIGGTSLNDRFTKAELEFCVAGTKGKVFLISAVCYSGSWTSPHWTMLAAAGENQCSLSMPPSGSGEYRGGFFTAALLADELSLNAPGPGTLLDEGGHRGQQREHDFGPDKSITPMPRSSKRTLEELREWICQYRDHLGGEYTTIDPTFSPCGSNEPHTLPFRSLATRAKSFHCFPCASPSPWDHQPTSPGSQTSTSKQPATPPSQPLTSTELTVSEEAELLGLAKNHMNYDPPPIPPEIPTTLKCWTIVHGPRPSGASLNNAEKKKLLSQLKGRVRRWHHAKTIALRLGWKEAVEDPGVPSHGRWQIMRDDRHLQRQAEQSGCHVKTLMIVVNNIHHWGGAASWLARVWEAAGCPGVTSKAWTMAIEGMDL